MRIFIVFLSISFLTGFTDGNSNQKPSVNWVSGIFESTGCKKVEIHGDHEEYREVCEEHRLVKQTTKIPMRIGTEFGFQYIIEPSRSEPCYVETRILEHPPITQPSGKVTKTYSRSYKVGNCPDALPLGVDTFSWYIENDWEAVKGEWIFRVLMNGTQVISEKFIAY